MLTVAFAHIVVDGDILFFVAFQFPIGEKRLKTTSDKHWAASNQRKNNK
nr:hypothetical protein [Providencia sp. G1(2023)]